MSIARDELRYNDLAVQLIKAVHRRFVYAGAGGDLHMRWKMSVDLRFAWVVSEGNLDPMDGYAVYRLLQERAQAGGAPAVLEAEIADLETLVHKKCHRFWSEDALDLGAALWVAQAREVHGSMRAHTRTDSRRQRRTVVARGAVGGGAAHAQPAAAGRAVRRGRVRGARPVPPRLPRARRDARRTARR